MGIKYIWDTNTAIYYLQQQYPPSAEKFMDNLVSEAQLVISAITEIELLCWKTATEKDIGILHNFIDDAPLLCCNASFFISFFCKRNRLFIKY